MISFASFSPFSNLHFIHFLLFVLLHVLAVFMSACLRRIKIKLHPIKTLGNLSFARIIVLKGSPSVGSHSLGDGLKSLGESRALLLGFSFTLRVAPHLSNVLMAVLGSESSAASPCGIHAPGFRFRFIARLAQVGARWSKDGGGGCELRAEKRMWFPARLLLFATFRPCDADGKNNQKESQRPEELPLPPAGGRGHLRRSEVGCVQVSGCQRDEII